MRIIRSHAYSAGDTAVNFAVAAPPGTHPRDAAISTFFGRKVPDTGYGIRPIRFESQRHMQANTNKPPANVFWFFRNLTKKRTFFFVFFVRPNFPFPELKSKTLYRPRSLWYPLALSHCRHYHHTTTTTSDLSLATR